MGKISEKCFYILMELGKLTCLDDSGLMYYFIKSIPNSKSNKSNPYQIKTIQDFKEQIKVYDKLRCTQTQPAQLNYMMPFSSSQAFRKSGPFSKKYFIYSSAKEGHRA